MTKIMLVEDDNNLREIYEARLAAEGYDIVAAPDGEAALALASKERPELIISDVMMPKISGFEMLDIIRNTDGIKNAKVIMLTALGQSEDSARAASLGADRYLVKSQVTLEDIVKATHELLHQDDDHTSASVAPDTTAPAEAETEPAEVTAPTTEPALAQEPTVAPMAMAMPPSDIATDTSVAAPTIATPPAATDEPASGPVLVTPPPADDTSSDPATVAPPAFVPEPTAQADDTSTDQPAADSSDQPFGEAASSAEAPQTVAPQESPSSTTGIPVIPNPVAVGGLADQQVPHLFGTPDQPPATSGEPTPEPPTIDAQPASDIKLPSISIPVTEAPEEETTSAAEVTAEAPADNQPTEPATTADETPSTSNDIPEIVESDSIPDFSLPEPAVEPPVQDLQAPSEISSAGEPAVEASSEQVAEAAPQAIADEEATMQAKIDSFIQNQDVSSDPEETTEEAPVEKHVFQNPIADMLAADSANAVDGPAPVPAGASPDASPTTDPTVVPTPPPAPDIPQAPATPQAPELPATPPTPMPEPPPMAPPVSPQAVEQNIAAALNQMTADMSAPTAPAAADQPPAPVPQQQPTAYAAPPVPQQPAPAIAQDDTRTDNPVAGKKKIIAPVSDGPKLDIHQLLEVEEAKYAAQQASAAGQPIVMGGGTPPSDPNSIAL